MKYPVNSIQLALAALLLAGAAGGTPSIAAEEPTANGAAAPQIDFSGEWDVAIGPSEMPYKGKLRLDRDGRGWKGVFINQEGVSTPLRAIVEDGKLVVRVEPEGGAGGTQTYRLDIVGEELKALVPVGDSGNQPLVARRVTPAKVTPAVTTTDPTGEWLLDVVAPDQTHHPTLVIERQGGRLVGSLRSPEGGVPLQTATLDGNRLNFTVILPIEGKQVPFDFSGVIEGDTIKGRTTVPGSVIPFTGKRTSRPMSEKAVADVAGTWDFVIVNENDNENYLGTVVIRKEGSGYAGTYTTADLVPPISAPLKEVSLSDDTLRFKVDLPVDAEPLHLEFEGKVTGDSIKGIEVAPQGRLPFTATRKRVDVNPVGDWAVEIKAPDQTHRGTVNIRKEGSGLAGTFSAPDGFSVPVSDVKVNGDIVTFHMTVPMEEGDPLRLDFEGKQNENRMEGIVRSRFGPITFTGERKAAPAPSTGKADVNLNGAWILTLETPNGSFTPEAVFKQEGTTLTGTMQGARGEMLAIRDGSVRDGVIRYTVAPKNPDGQEIIINFNGKIEGEKIVGEITAPFGTMKATGVRKEAASPPQRSGSADLTGNWDLKLVLPNGETGPSELVLKQMGETLTGTMQGPTGQHHSFREGTVKDGAISYLLVLNAPDGQEMRLNFKGKLEGEKIVGDLTAPFGTIKVTGARKK